jgi:hypothetical protein
VNYRIKRVLFHNAVPCLGSRAWFESLKQGGVKTAEYDTVLEMVELHSPSELIRVPREAVAEIVLGPTVASKKP